MKKTFSAFTLAEVLITLGIIGVVAAMTMPTLMNQTNGAQYKAAYKKALSAISQGVTLNVALEDESFADKSPDTILRANNRMNVVKNTTNGLGYTISSKTTNLANADIGNTTLFFNDGSVFQFPTANASCTAMKDGKVAFEGSKKANDTRCFGFIDVNGAKGPNKETECDGGGTKKTDCVVTSPRDIYPVMYYDQTILPATDAARAVLYGK